MNEIKKVWEVYRDTGVMGAYHPDMAKLQEIYTGSVLSLFDDTEYCQHGDEVILMRDMVIGGKVFHISSVFREEDVASSTPTEKLLSHIDLQLKKEAQGA